MSFSVTFTDDLESPIELTPTKIIGHGKFKVFHAKGPEENQEFAVKIFPDDRISHSSFLREQDRLNTVNHPHIIKSYPVSKHNAESELIVMEYASHGDFFDLVTKGGLAHEVHMRTYFHQLIEGLEYLHSKDIAHLDLKLDNLLMGKDFQLKITDFDQSQLKGEERLISAGTSCYRAPEIREKCCMDPFAADVFSAGIILYVFKSMQFPFLEVEEDGENKVLYYDVFMEDNEEFWQMKTEKMGKKEDFFSDDFKSLVKGMLECNPSKRLTIEGIKATEWYNKPILSPEGLKFHMSRAYQRMSLKEDSNSTPKTISLFKNLSSFGSLLSFFPFLNRVN